MPWKQFAYLNAFWASLCVVFVYAFVHRVTASIWAAALAACFHFGCGFFLLLAVISEDIMPGYTLVLGAMVLAGLWFDRPSHRRVALVGALFTLGWLIEWRLMFPTLPALILALALSEGRPTRRLALIGTLIVSILAVAGIVQLLWEGHNGAMGLHDILWTGKGVTTGWAGLSTDKAWMMLSGIGNYFLIVGGWVDPLSAKRAAAPLVVSRSCCRRRSSWPASSCCGHNAPTGGCGPLRSSFWARWVRVRYSTSIRSRKTRRCRSTSCRGSPWHGACCWARL